MDNLTVRFLENAVRLLKKTKSSEKINSVINQLRFKSLEFSTCKPNKINPSEVCMHCGSVWRDGLFSLQVKCHKNNKIRRQIKKIDHLTKLTPCRKAFLAYYKSQKDNILLKKCLVCKSITKFSMSKPSSTSVNEENVSLKCIENPNTKNRKRKRKSGKNQSFAGLSPAAVIQAKLNSYHTKVEDTSLQASDVSKVCQPLDVKNLSVSTFVKNNPLSFNAKISDKNTPSKTIAQTVSQSNLSLEIHQANAKKLKLKNSAITVSTKKSLKKKKKSFLTEVLSFL